MRVLDKTTRHCQSIVADGHLFSREMKNLNSWIWTGNGLGSRILAERSHWEVGQIYAGQKIARPLKNGGGRENPCLAWICPTPAQTGGFSASRVGLRCIPDLREASRRQIRRPTSAKAPGGTPDARPPRSLRVGFFPPDLREKAEVGKIPAGPILARPGPRHLGPGTLSA